MAAVSISSPDTGQNSLPKSQLLGSLLLDDTRVGRGPTGRLRKHLNRLALLAVFSTALLGLVVLVCLLCMDYSSAEYSDMSAAVAGGEVKRGWIPGFMPDYVFDIHLKHRIEDASIFMHFSFPRSQFGAIRQLLTQLDFSEPAGVATLHPAGSLATADEERAVAALPAWCRIRSDLGCTECISLDVEGGAGFYWTAYPASATGRTSR